MEKRLDKLSQRKERIQLSCSWGFTNLLDFKNGGKNQKLLTNGRHKPKNVSDAGDQRNDFSFDMQVQNLLRQEIKNKNSAKKCTHSDMEQKRASSFSLFKQLQNKNKKAINYCKKTHQKSLSSTLTSSDNHVMDKMLEEVCHQIYSDLIEEDLQRNIVPLNNDQLDHAKMQLLQTKVKAFIDQIYKNRKNCSDTESKQFLEADKILKLNMDVFLKLMQREHQTGNACDYKDHISTTRTKENDSNGCSLASRRIVILKPESKVKQSVENVSCHCSSLQSHYSLKNKGQIKGATFLAFDDIKKKFRQSIGTNLKQQEKILGHEKRSQIETFDKKIDIQEQQKLDLFEEAKRHLSERLKAANLGKNKPNKEGPRTLKMILSSRDLTPTISSNLQNEAVKIESLQQSPNQTKEISSCSIEKKQVFEFRPSTLELELDNIQSFPDAPLPSDLAYKIRKYVDSSNLDICKLQIIENIKEKEEYRSPVSVLEPFSFDEGDSSPSMIPRSAESKLQPRCLNFEDISFGTSLRDHQIESRTSINEEEEDCLSLYVRAVIHVSGLSFNEFSSENTLRPDVLHSYIDNEVRPFASDVDCDTKLLLDCVHEVIVGVYGRRVTRNENFIDEVLKEVKCCVHQKNGQPTLYQLVKKDIASSSSWFDLRDYTEDIVIHLAEDFLHDSILDIMLDS